MNNYSVELYDGTLIYVCYFVATLYARLGLTVKYTGFWLEDYNNLQGVQSLKKVYNYIQETNKTIVNKQNKQGH